MVGMLQALATTTSVDISITSPSLFLISVQSAIPLLVPSAVGGK